MMEFELVEALPDDEPWQESVVIPPQDPAVKEGARADHAICIPEQEYG